MHIILGALAVIGMIIFLWYRVRDAREVGGEMLDAADGLRASVRRLMYKHKHNVHPADAVDDPRLAASGIAVAVATMDAPLSQGEIEALSKTSQDIFDITEREALDIVSFGRWVAGQCNTNQEAVRRLSKVVSRLAGADAGPDLIRLITDVATTDDHDMGEEEMDAIETVRRTLGMA